MFPLPSQGLFIPYYYYIMPHILQVSQLWFGEGERIVSTSLMSVTPTLAVIFASVLSPLITSDQVDRIKYLNICYASPSLVCLVFGFLFCYSSAPPTPPTKSAENLVDKNNFSFRQYLSSLRQVLSNKSVLGFMIFIGSSLAIFNALVSQLSQVMCSTGYSAQEVGFTTALVMLSGVVGGVASGVVARRLGRPVQVLKILYCLSSLTLIISLLLLREENLLVPTILSLVVFGFCLMGCFPLALELGAEETFPVSPVYSETCVHFPAHAYGFVLIVLCNSLARESSPDIVDTCGEGIRPRDYTVFFYFLMGQVTLCSCLVLYLINPALRRQVYDEK